VTVGAQLDTAYGIEVELAGASVTSIFHAKFEITNRSHFMSGLSFDMGDAAALRLRNNVVLVVTTAAGALFAVELFQLAGIDPLRREPSLVVANSVNGFRATFHECASLILNCEAPGCAPPRFYLPQYEGSFSQLGRPRRRVFPWDGRLSDGGDGLEQPLHLELGPTTLEKLRVQQELSLSMDTE
jgi:microcystin degradation protein MlrC